MFKSIDRWLPGYIGSVLNRPRHGDGLRHLMFCVADHFEPLELLERSEDSARGGYQPTRAERLQIVGEWAVRYPDAVEAFRDSDGLPPRHTFFCAPNDYAPDWMEMLAGLCRRGFGEVELHLHHRNDTAEGLTRKLCEFRDRLRNGHGLLGSWRGGGRWEVGGGRAALSGAVPSSDLRMLSSPDRAIAWSANPPVSLPPSTFHLPPPSAIAFGFIHGNWALCNSHPDGNWCGVNEELSVLSRTGCYADFTFPSAPSPTQPRMVNAIYRARDTGRPRAQDKGVGCEVRGVCEVRGGSRCNLGGGGLPGSPILRSSALSSSRQSSIVNQQSPPLMLIQGPLALDWRRRKWGMFPHLDNGGITHHNPPAPARIELWVEQGIHVRGRPEWVFVKVYTHGCIPSSSRVFLGEAMHRAHEHLQAKYNDGKSWKLHYVTAREMYNIIRAAEDGRAGEPGEYRDHEVLPPAGGALIP